MGEIAKVVLSKVTYDIDKPYDFYIPPLLREEIFPGVRVLVPFGKSNRKTEGMVVSIADTSAAKQIKPIISVIDNEFPATQSQIKLALWMRGKYYCTCYDAFRTIIPSCAQGKRNVDFISMDMELSHDEALSASGRSAPQREIVEMLLSEKNRSLKLDAVKARLGDKAQSAINGLKKKGIIISENVFCDRVGDKTQRIVTLNVGKDELERYFNNASKRQEKQLAVLELLSGCVSASAREIMYDTGASISVINTLSKKGLVAITETEVLRGPVDDSYGDGEINIKLTSEQKKVFDELSEMTEARVPSAALLYGVTGSGKTEVYIKLVEKVVKAGRCAIVLVPEISLTPQMMERFMRAFGRKMAIFHSSLSTGERHDEYKRMKNGDAMVVLGTRSAVFAPFDNLGIIIIDEEHEHTYKSETSPRYDAIDIAKFRCVEHNAVLLLGSATPSLSSYHSAKEGRYKFFKIKSRYSASSMPDIITADMVQELKNGSSPIISDTLRFEIDKNLKAGEQTILFLNRRGYDTRLTCVNCGSVAMCPNCSVSLTYHSANGRKICHYCGYSEECGMKCSACGCENSVKNVGFGTQRAEEELLKLFPEARVIRMDADTTSRKESHRTMLSDFRKRKADILLGTQMISKGLDIENVTLVGVLSADMMLFLDDYKAPEKTFSMLTQVIGRSGRGEKPGRAVLQTYSPKHPVIGAVAAGAIEEFYENELAMRKVQKFPPWLDLLTITVSSKYQDRALSGVIYVKAMLQSAIKKSPGTINELLGPVQAGIFKINGKYRYRLLIKAIENKTLRELLGTLQKLFMQDKRNRMCDIHIDLNPYYFS